jgi:hypothetical protein
MEFYLSFADLFEKLPNKIGAIFIPVFLVTILVEALFIRPGTAATSGKIRGSRRSSRSGTW